MKNFIKIAAVTLLLPLAPLSSYALITKAPIKTVESKSANEIKVLELRINEINKMDKTNLKASEKKTLRKEVKSINHKMQIYHHYGYAYVSAGTLLLIVLLVIILL